MKKASTYRQSPRIIFSGGGTGGHIYPAIAVADYIRKRLPEAEILFVGAQGRMEMRKVPQAGYEIIGLWISGLQRRLTFSNLLFPIKVISSFLKSRRILGSFNPDVVAGFGGYASGPIMIAATRKGIKTVIQEQNSYAGMANRSVAGKADRICVAYDGMEKYFPADKIRITGNPVREDIMDLKEKVADGRVYFSLNDSIDTILVLGGSLGARTINESMIRNMEEWIASGYQIMWQTGKLYFEEMKERMTGFDDQNIRLLEFIDRMDLAYAVADVIISRAGAIAISELTLVAKPVVFVPSSNVAEDHQTKNAMAVVSKDAALVVSDHDAIGKLAGVALGLMKNSDKRMDLGRNMGLLARPGATKDIADEILKLAKVETE